ncbi:outer membrane protein assembly factor BamB family protein [Bremerella alba]|uniref:Outer membrane protein assembly factor BamB n=1 Tax=Bremerella alba TaxID=980252 RepID=A0A7V8V5L1_9BACT|nr:PQQ-binding-like beta-propeller repeat protein [Bremerella alba]MBA2115196.1 Outer membrane protein assembly factor BamB [Bremerella alba]
MSNEPVHGNPEASESATSQGATGNQDWYVPPRRIWIIASLFLLLGVVGFFGRVLGNGPLADLYDAVWIFRDPAICNVMALIGGFFACFIPLMWFTFRSSWPAAIRFAPFTLISLAVVGFFVVFEIQGVSGEMIPRFGYRFGKAPDQRLGEFTAAGSDQETKQSLSVEDDPNAFPQFLGPDGNSRLAGPSLETDWAAHAPEEIWRIPIGAGWSGFSALDGRIYTMEQRDNQELVTCYDMQSGEPIWGTPVEARHYTVMGYVGPRCTPLLFDGRVYASGATGVLRCLDPLTGEVVWQHDLLEMYGVSPSVEKANIAWGRSNSPLGYELEDRKIVIIPAGGPDKANKDEMVSLVAFDAATGETVWEGGQEQISYASPSIAQVDGKDQIISVNEATITGHDPATGKQLWSFDWPGNSSGNASCSQVHSLGDNRFFVSKGYGQGASTFAVKPEGDGFTTEELWSNARVLKTKFTNVAILSDDVFGLNDGILEKVELEAKRPQWRERGFGHGQVLLVDDVLLVMGEEGNLAAVDTTSEDYHEFSRIKALSSEIAPTWNPLCLYGDLLLVRNAEEAACFKLPTKD